MEKRERDTPNIPVDEGDQGGWATGEGKDHYRTHGAGRLRSVDVVEDKLSYYAHVNMQRVCKLQSRTHEHRNALLLLSLDFSQH